MTKPNKTGRQDRQEHFTKMIRNFMEEPAWRALLPAAQALYPWLKLEWRGPDANNNGSIRFSTRQAGHSMGVRPDTASRAFHDLQAKGFLVLTEHACLGVGGAAKSPSYEITEIPLPYADRREGRKLYKQWKPGSDFPVQRAAAHNPTGANGKAEPCHEKRDDAVTKTVTKLRRSS